MMSEINFTFHETRSGKKKLGKSSPKKILYRAYHENGSGFMPYYIDTCKDLFKNVSQVSALRIFF